MPQWTAHVATVNYYDVSGYRGTYSDNRRTNLGWWMLLNRCNLLTCRVSVHVTTVTERMPRVGEILNCGSVALIA